jgi:steroid delta-isomerase-like uncharacterized protein
MKPEEMKAPLVKMNDDAWHKRDLDAAYAIYADDVVFHSPPSPPVARKEANKQADADILTAFTETRSTIHGTVVEGNLTVVRWTWEAMHTGTTPSLGLAPTGKQVSKDGCTAYWFDGDKVVEQWEYADWLGLLQQLGVIPTLS